MTSQRGHRHSYRKDGTCACGVVRSDSTQEMLRSAFASTDPMTSYGGIEIKLEPDNPGTVVLSRWPTEEEKPEVERQIVRLKEDRE